MTTLNLEINKQPFKVIEIPLNKFNDEAIPHHQMLFETHKSAVQKLISTKNLQQLSKEVKDKKRIVRQLKDLMYELDTLRARVEDNDLDKFDSKTFTLRKIITSLVKDYAAVEKNAQVIIQADIESKENAENQDPFQAASQLQIQGDLQELKLKDKENRLQKVEALHEDIQDLHGIFVDLNTMVNEQKESVDIIETNVEASNENVNEGIKHLVKACKLKTAAYPVTGALLGSIIGGPLGFVAGFKAGGLAALGCGLAGYTGGKLMKKYNDPEEENSQDKTEEKFDKEEPVVASSADIDKKDI